MDNARREGAGAELSSRFDSADNTPRNCKIQAATRAIASALICDPRPPAEDLAVVLRDRLTEPELIHTGAAITWALRPRTALAMADATEADALDALRIAPNRVGKTPAIEAERQRRRWASYARSPDRLARLRREATR